MTPPSRAEVGSEYIDLARIADFALGPSRVLPSACEVMHPGGTARLQRRVMQVLVALAETAGEPVSRDVLRQRCWGGQIVGEDSISRCIQSLRRLAESETPRLFLLETIPRIGYRLSIESADGSEPGEEPARSQASRWRPPAWATWTIIAAGVLVLGLVARIAGERSRVGPRWRLAGFERLVPELPNMSSPAISPDGRLIVFTVNPWRSDSRHLFLSLLRHGDPVQLTNGVWDETAPAWSPDGTHLAYVVQQPEHSCRMMVMPALGGPAREVGGCGLGDRTSLAWTPSGDGLFFADAADPGSPAPIIRLDLTTGARQPITRPTPGQLDLRPRLSPDGRRLAFLRSLSAMEANVWIHDLDSGAERLIAPAKGDASGFAWAEDSRSIILIGGPGEESELWSYPVDGGNPSLVGKTALKLARLASGPGGLLAAEVFGYRDELMRSPAGVGGSASSVDAGPGDTFSFDVANDGTLALASNRSGESAIWLNRPEGKLTQVAAYGAAALRGLAWSADGKHLAFVWVLGRRRVLRVIDRGGLEVAAIRLPGTSNAEPAWTGDGRAILCPVSDPSGWRLWRFELAREGARAPVGTDHWRSLVSRGNEFYGTLADRPGIWRLAFPPRSPSRALVAAFPAASLEAWTVFRDLVLVADQRTSRIWAVPLRGGRPRLFAQALPNADLSDFAVDPTTGGVIYRSRVQETAGIELFHLRRD